MNEQEFYKLQTCLKAARDRLASLKAEKLILRKDRWELSDFKLFKQFDKLMGEEIKEFEKAYYIFESKGGGSSESLLTAGLALLYEIADCQNVLDGIAYLVMREAGIP